MNEVCLDLQADFAALATESVGWLPLGDGAYLHTGNPEQEELVITVVDVAGMLPH